MPMTQDEMENELLMARKLIPADLAHIKLDRSRHERTLRTSLWVFSLRPNETQIGSVSRTLDAGFKNEGVASLQWKANRLHRGSPVSEKYYSNLFEALDHVLQGDHT